jgi:hypothetical protein
LAKLQVEQFIADEMAMSTDDPELVVVGEGYKRELRRMFHAISGKPWHDSRSHYDLDFDTMQQLYMLHGRQDLLSKCATCGEPLRGFRLEGIQFTQCPHCGTSRPASAA